MVSMLIFGKVYKKGNHNFEEKLLNLV